MLSRRHSIVLESCVAVKLALAFLDLVLHQLVDPKSHINVVFEHQLDHLIEREPKVIFLNRELSQLFVQLSQFLIALVD